MLTTIIGQCVGGRRYDRVCDYLKCAMGYGCGLLVVLSLLVIGFARQLSGLFVRSGDVAAIVAGYFLIVSVGYILNTVTNCYLGLLNGMGKPSRSMLLMVFYYIVVRMPLAYLLSGMGFGLNGIWAAVLVSHVAASAAALVARQAFRWPLLACRRLCSPVWNPRRYLHAGCRRWFHHRCNPGFLRDRYQLLHRCSLYSLCRVPRQTASS